MSIPPSRGYSITSLGFRKKRGLSTNNGLLSDNTNPTFHQNEVQDLNNSRVDFLDRQTLSKQNYYKQILKITTIISSIVQFFTLGVISLWLYWLLKINSDSLICINLKHQIVWVVFVYFMGILSQIFGVVTGYFKYAVGFIIYEVLLLVLFVLRIVLDVNVINDAFAYLEGCAGTKAEFILNNYLYAVIFYCIMLLVLFACHLSLIYGLNAVKKAERVQEDYAERNESFR